MLPRQEQMKTITITYRKIFGAFVVLSLLVACENDINQVRALDTKKPNLERAKDLVGYMSDGGHIKGELHAPVMTRSYTDSGVTEFPKSLKVFLYDDSAKVDTKIFAKYGRYVTTTNRIFLRDSVVISTRNKDTIRTSELYCDQITHRIYTAKPTWIHRHLPEEEYIYAKGGMTANSQDLVNYTLYDAQIGSFIKYSESALGPGGM